MIGWIILALVVLFLAVLVIRALLFKPLPEKARKKEEISFDKDSKATWVS